MTQPTLQTPYLYVRSDADFDVSADTMQFSLDKVTWVNGSFVTTGSLPTRVAAVDAATPPQAGLQGFWWRVLVGVGQTLIPPVGNSILYGKLAAAPQTIIFEWPLRLAD